MELEFEKTQMQCLQQILSQIKDLELTQEVKLSEEMPDVGNILGAWGQVLIRGKEWRSSSVGVSGGVMCWVMYMPEEDTQPRMVEGWMPFQVQMDVPESTHDGQICVIPALKLMDARSVAAGKIMMRACVSLQVKANVPMTVELYSPPKLSSDVQLLENSYRMQIPCEAGEKAFVMDEEFSIDGEQPEKLLRYWLQPVITEKKVMAGKLVFRGSAMVQGLYKSNESLHSFRMDIPFAQYVELEQDRDPEATAWVYPAVTSLELELTGGNNVHMKAGIIGQYMICDQMDVTLVEDAYSTAGTLQMHSQTLEIPRVLEEKQQQVFADFVQKEPGQVVDVVFYPDQPRTQRNADGVEHQLSGRYQMLCYDRDGCLRSETGRWEQAFDVKADEKTKPEMYVYPASHATAGGVELMCEYVTMAWSGMETVTGLTLSEGEEKAADRPSLILRKKGDASLWQIAKETGSTVERIKNANGLEGEPSADKMLLIPV